MNIGIPRETFPGERRVALVPASVSDLAKKGLNVYIESGAGDPAGFTDGAYIERGAKIEKSRHELLKLSDVILQVRTPGADPNVYESDLELLKAKTIIGLMDPLTAGREVKALADAGITSFSLELLPRITRAQSMDVLSSQATIAGYKAAIMAAYNLPRMYPMLITAAGTVTAARIFVIGAGVAGLQAIATCHRLGAAVQAYDVRPVVKEQVQSVGGKFIELELSSAGAEDKGGYAKAMDEEFYSRQREMMARIVSASDAVITTAAVPGMKAPVLITADMVKEMAPGSIIIDIAAERGGNCALTKPGETIVENGVTVMGPLNIASSVPYHASQMYSKNISTFLLHLLRNGSVNINDDDQIIRETIVTADEKIINIRVKEALKIS